MHGDVGIDLLLRPVGQRTDVEEIEAMVMPGERYDRASLPRAVESDLRPSIEEAILTMRSSRAGMAASSCAIVSLVGEGIRPLPSVCSAI